MHIKKINIQNIFSYEDATFHFEKYNVIVGANNAGKTNFVRILDMISKSSDLNYTELYRNDKLNDSHSAQISLTIELTNEETKHIFQTITGQFINSMDFSKELKIFDVIIYWGNIVQDVSHPNLILLKFHSGLTIIMQGSLNISFDYKLSFNSNDLFEEAIENSKNMEHEERIEYIRKKGTMRFDGQLGSSTIISKTMNKGSPIEDIFQRDGINFSTEFPLIVEQINDKQTLQSREVMDFIKMKKSPGSSQSVRLSSFLSQLFKMNYQSIEEIHPSILELVTNLVNLRDVYDSTYTELRTKFREITNGVEVKVGKMNPHGEPTKQEMITLTENKKTYLLENTASGYYALVHILHLILEKPNQMIVIDEPEVHFHPIMISRLAKNFTDISKSNNNQIIIISHSPRFVNYKLIDSRQPNVLTSIIKKDHKSLVHSTPRNFIPKLKPHLFDSDMFFGLSSLIVEGSDDYFAMKAISDYFDGLFEKYDITLIHCWGVGNVFHKIEIHNAFKIPFVAMTDNEYAEDQTNVIKLPIDLEDEYEKLGWERKPGQKVKDDAYPFMEWLLKQEGGLDKLKTSPIWTAFETIIKNTNGKIPTTV
jgi:predicted ATPase